MNKEKAYLIITSITILVCSTAMITLMILGNDLCFIPLIIMLFIAPTDMMIYEYGGKR